MHQVPEHDAPSPYFGAPDSGATIGVEEEFLLIDESGRMAPSAAPAVLAALSDPATLTDDSARMHSEPSPFKAELQDTQIEATTPVRTNLADIAEDLRSHRQRLAQAAREAGAMVLPAGTSIMPYSQVDTLPSVQTRYGAMKALYAGGILNHHVCASHVHVGVGDDPERATAALNHLRVWLPTLVAMNANSPFMQGHDTGYASWRTMEQARFPSAGMPAYSASAKEYKDRLTALVNCGALLDRRTTFWLARRSQRYPTIEIRCADSLLTSDDTLLYAALSRALVQTALKDADRGLPPITFDEQMGSAAVWSAARYGLSGFGVDLRTNSWVPARNLLDEMVDWVTPALQQTGDLALVERLLHQLNLYGTGAERQRGLAAHFGLERVATQLALAQSSPVGAE